MEKYHAYRTSKIGMQDDSSPLFSKSNKTRVRRQAVVWSRNNKVLVEDAFVWFAAIMAGIIPSSIMVDGV